MYSKFKELNFNQILAMYEFTEVAQSISHNVLSMAHAYAQFTKAFLLVEAQDIRVEAQDIRESMQGIKMLETVVFGTIVFPWLVCTVVRYGSMWYDMDQ